MAVLVGMLNGACASGSGPLCPPEIIRAGGNEVVVAWDGGANTVEYWPLGKPERVSRAVDQADTRVHEVRIGGLTPGSHYSYRIEGTEAVYQTQTAPPASGAFSFFLFRDVSTSKLLRHLISDAPGFLLSTFALDASAPDADPYADLRPFVGVYDPAGNTAAYLRNQPSQHRRDGYRVEWGCLILAVSDSPEYLQKQINTLPSGFTLGLLTRQAAVAALDFTPLQRHAESVSTAPVFGMVRDAEEDAQNDDIRLVSVAGSGRLLEVTVNPESVYMTEIPSGEQTVLRAAPVNSKRTCAECRRLADSGAYKQSVAAYLSFIESNAGHHLIDDAFFEVANIYDEKLFDFREAIRWYAALEEAYPRSSLTPFARERLSYLRTFGPEEFPVLEKFERIRRVTYFAAEPDERKALIDEVLELSNELSRSALAPSMLYWAGNQLRKTRVADAIAIYRILVADYPTHANAANATYAIAETLYDAGLYRAARDAYVAALTELPDRESTVRAQIARCSRNIRRQVILWGAVAVLVAVTLASLLFRRHHRRRLYLNAAVLGVLLGTVLSLYAWTIRHQFESSTLRLALAWGAALAGAAAPPLVNPIVCGMGVGRVKGSVLAGCLGSVVVVSALYILICVAFDHYLTVFGL